MKIIDFEKAKAGKYQKKNVLKTQNEIDAELEEMKRQYREYAQFCNQWYDEHVVGQDKDGRWIYKD